MPCPHPAVPSPVLALAGWCPLLPTGAQTTQLLVEPPWRPAVLWDRVTLTCQGLGTTSATTWYKDGQQWWKEAPNNFAVNRSGTYQCDRPGSGFSPTVRVLNGEGSLDWVVLQVPARPLLEGDTVTLRCRGWRDMSVTGVQFYHGNEEVSRSPNRTKLSLSPLQLNHSSQYRCRGWLKTGESWQWQQLAPVTVTVHGEPHPHSLPGSPSWGHSAPSGNPRPCLRTPITAQTPHPCSGSLIHFWVYHQIPQPYVGTPIFPVNFFYVPPSLLESPSLSPHPSMGHFACT
uniref:Ig-like domain-containing protein n=1 Tax=Zosterops lateralis melanops TaxID=1220523 RepID=A0A8D2PN00_ZOSLA